MRKIHPLVTFGSLLLGACSQLSSSVIQIENDGGSQLSAINVDVGGRHYQIDLIRAHGSGSITFDPVSDSAVELRYMLEGRERTCVGDVYVSTNPRVHISVVVRPDGSCVVTKK